MNATKMTDKQTAVEWLQEKLNKILIDNQIQQTEHLFEQAKEMEKEQKIEFANDYGFHICGYDYENATEYFNETFNPKQNEYRQN